MAYYTVGVITGTHGLRGEVKVLPRTDFELERFRVGGKLFVRKEGELPFREVTIRSARPHKQFWLVALEELPTINDVEHWRGIELCIDDTQLVELPEGTYYFHQLIGLEVETEEGLDVGELVDILTPGANDVYVVRGPMSKRDILLPAIPDCIRRVDPEAGRMIVHLMPGLLDEDDVKA